jgi:SAM-dependent methyltransferase
VTAIRTRYGDCDDRPEHAPCYDDVPLWSAPFGLRLLDTVRLRAGVTALDVGCGTGFPLVELAERLGRTSRAHGVDPWIDALARVRAKLAARGVENVTLHEGRAEQLPLPDASVDLVVSNNGLNSVDDLDRALAECARVARPGAQLVFTWNLPETMHEVYDVLEPVLGRALGDPGKASRLVDDHIFGKRKPIGFMQQRVEAAGFVLDGIVTDEFELAFADATAMFDHWFMRLAFIGPWLVLAPEPLRVPVFQEVERRLNEKGDLRLSVPFACLDARRAQGP